MMQTQLNSALERIENPILIILLVVLILACIALWFANRALQNRLMEALLQNVAAMTNLNATLGNTKERLDIIDQRISLLEKNA